jgi:putative membrane protein
MMRGINEKEVFYTTKEVVMMHWGNYGWGMGFGWIYMLFFWIIVITAIVYLVKFLAKSSGPGECHETPLDILKRRYSKGEITREEFERIKNDFKKN